MLLLAEFFACCFWLAAGTYNNFLEMVSQTSPQIVGQIAETLRSSRDAAHLRNSISSSVQTLVSPGPDHADVVLTDTEKYVAIRLSSSEYALSPHARRPNCAASFGISNWDTARNWIGADQDPRNG